MADTEPTPGDDDITTNLPDLTNMPLADIAGDEDEATVQRVVPADGTQLLVAASFQSAI